MRNWVLKSFVVAILVIGFAGIEGCGQDASLTIDLRPTPVPATPTVAPTLAPSPTPSGTPTATATPTPAPTPPPAACSGQGLIGIDPVNNIAYVPTGGVDTKGNATVDLVDLTKGAVKPIVKTLSLTGATTVPAVAFNPNNNTMLAEGFTASAVNIYEIDTATETVKNTVAATGLTNLGRGGVLEDATTNKAYVADESDLGVLDTSKSPPVWDATSVVVTVCSDSLALNSVTGVLFVSCDGSNQIIDTTKTPLVPQTFQSLGATTDGVAFDIATNVAILSAEVGLDESFGLNFATLNTTVTPATADNVTVPGAGCTDTTCNGETPPIGEGPGGQAVINCSTHQATIADEGGQNLKLVQLPVAPVTGPLNNNGQPGSGTTADAASVFTISGTVVPTVSGATLTIDGDPNSLSVDPATNFAYMRATGPTGKFLVGVDLSKPVLGANSKGGADGKTFWTPASVVIPLD